MSEIPQTTNKTSQPERASTLKLYEDLEAILQAIATGGLDFLATSQPNQIESAPPPPPNELPLAA